MNKTSSHYLRRGAVALVSVVVLLAGCGSSDDDASAGTTVADATPADTTSATTPDTAPGATEAPADTAASPTTDAPVDSAPPASINADGTVTITHEYGTFDIPLEPERVLVLENRRDLETAVVLDLPLRAVGIYGTDTSNVAAPFVPVDLDGVEIINNSELNLEQIAALDPDLILARDIYLNDGEAEQLAAIAPILPVAGDGPWRDDLEQVAGWMQRSDLLDEALAEYDAAVEDVATRHADALASTPVAIVEYYPADQTFYAGGIDDFQLQANTLGELGGKLVPFLADRSYFDEPFSIENLSEIADAGVILLVSNSQADIDALAANPLWQALPAVQAGNVVITDTRTNQGSVFAATESVRLLDQLYTPLD
jgi:iron complex transport system substrate-binding protein